MDLLMEVTQDGDDANLPIEVPPEIGESQDIAIEIDDIEETDQPLASNENESEHLKVITPSKSVRKSTSMLLLDFAEESDDESRGKTAKLKNSNVCNNKDHDDLDDEVENLISSFESSDKVIEKIPLFKDGDQPAIIITHRKSKDQDKDVFKETDNIVSSENGVTSTCPSDSESLEHDLPIREKASVRTFSSQKSSSSVMVLDIDPIHDIHAEPTYIKKEMVSKSETKTDVKKAKSSKKRTNVNQELPNHSFKKKAAKAFVEQEKKERKQVDKEINTKPRTVRKMTVSLTNIDYALQEICCTNALNITEKLIKKVNPSIQNTSIDHSKDPTQDVISITAKTNHGVSSVSKRKSQARPIEKKSPISKNKIRTVEKLKNKTTARKKSQQMRVDLSNILNNSGTRRGNRKESFQNILKSPSPILTDLDVSPIMRSTPRKRTSSGLQKDNKPLSQKRKASGEGSSNLRKNSVGIEDVEDAEETTNEPSQKDIQRSSESPEKSGHESDSSFVVVEDTEGNCLFDSRNHKCTEALIVKVFSNGYEHSNLRVNKTLNVKEGAKPSKIFGDKMTFSQSQKGEVNNKKIKQSERGKPALRETNGIQNGKQTRDKTPKINVSLEIQPPEIGLRKTRQEGKDHVKDHNTSRSDKSNQKEKDKKGVQMEVKTSFRSKELQHDKIISIYKGDSALDVTGSRRKSLKKENPPLLDPDIFSKFSLRETKLCLKKLSDRECELGGKPTFDDMFPELNVSSGSLSWKTSSTNVVPTNVHEETPFSIAAVLNSLEEDSD